MRAISTLAVAIATSVTALSSPAQLPNSEARAVASTTSTSVASPAPRTNPGWGLDRIDQRRPPVNRRYAPSATGAGVTVYVVDTGVEVTHAQFGGRARNGYDARGRGGRDCPDEIGIGHGTFVAGIVGGRTTGVAPGVRLVNVAAIACGEGESPVPLSTQVTHVVKALTWIADHAHKPAVVQMSFNFPRNSKIDAAAWRLVAKGLTLVAAAGNDDADACADSPQRVSGVIVVAASTPTDRSWREGPGIGTGKGRCVNIYAPGFAITSVALGGGTYKYDIGATSWATPFVSGAAALYLQRHPLASGWQVRSWMFGRATKGVLRGVPAKSPNRLLYVGP